MTPLPFYREAAMNLSSQAKADLTCICLFSVASLGLLMMIATPSLDWLRGSLIWIWFEYCAILFFMRAVFILPIHPSPWPQFVHGICRTLGVFGVSLLPMLGWLHHFIPMDRSEYWLGVYLWMGLPAMVGCSGYLLGFLLRTLSNKIGD